jgi:predicted transcriptional regulator of viral defense system
MEKQNTPQRNDQDYRLLALAAARSEGRAWALLSSDMVKETLGLSPLQAARLFTRLLREQRIQRLQRGLYLVPASPPPGKRWVPSSYDALWAYMGWLGATWQIAGYAAFTRHGFSTQVVQRMTVFNDKLSGEETVGGSRFVFVKLPNEKLGFTRTYPMAGGIEIVFSSRMRTLFDAVAEAKRFSTLPEAYGWFWGLRQNPLEVAELKQICLAIGNSQTAARIGFVLEELGFDASELLPKIGSAGTLVPLAPLPQGARKGTTNKRWRIIENISLSKIFAAEDIADEDE